MAMQYVAVKFRRTDSRSYTYHYDGPPLRIGDRVKIPDRRDPTAWSAGEVVGLPTERPKFETKAILGPVDGATIDEKLLKAPPAETHKPDLFRDYVEDTRAGLAGPGMFPDVFGDD